MKEVISCKDCQIQFHQSFLSSHVEAYHVEARNEEMIALSCISCPFSVDVLNKNSMVQHCFVTGHSIKNVEAQFNGYLLAERSRISHIMNICFKILKSNSVSESVPKIKPPTDQSQIAEPPNIFPMKKKTKEFLRKRKTNEIIESPIYKEPAFEPKEPEVAHVLTHLSNIKPTHEMTCKKPNRSLSMALQNESVSDGNIVKPEKNKEPQAEKNNEVSLVDQRSGTMACEECRREISLTRNIGHNLSKAVGHVISHLPDLRLYSCRFCEFQTKYKPHMRIHLQRKHNGASIDSAIFLHNPELEAWIKNNISHSFPLLKWNRDLNVFKYV